MAIGTPTLRDASGAISSSVTSASFTPAANSILFCWAGNDGSGSPSATPAISDSLGGSWTQIGSTVTLSDLAGALFYRTIGGSPSSMTVTSTCSDGERVTINVFDVTGAGTDFSNTASGTSGTGDPSFSISSPAGTSAVFGFAFALGGNNFTPPSGYTELSDTSPASTTRRTTTVYDLSSPGTTLTWSSTNGNCVAFAVEIKEASGGSTTLAANGGSYAVTGTAATLKFGRLLTSVAGSYAIGGTAANLVIGKGLEALGGSYAVTGAAATLLRSLRANADGASYSISGAVANPLVGRAVVAGGGSYAITGGPAAFVKGFGLPANGGTYTITGAAATLRATHRLIADPNSYLVIGAAVLLHYSGAGAGAGGLIPDRRRRR